MGKKIKDDNFYQVQGWMINHLHLKGTALSLYAIIYGFTQDGEGEYVGGLQYLSDFAGGLSKRTVSDTLKKLVALGYVECREGISGGVRFKYYKISTDVVKNVRGGSEIFSFSHKSNNKYIQNKRENAPARAYGEKNAYGEFENVLLTEEEYSLLCERFGENARKLINNLSLKMRSKGYRYEDHYATLLLWAEGDGIADAGDGASSKSYDTDAFFDAAMDRSYEEFSNYAEDTKK